MTPFPTIHQLETVCGAVDILEGGTLCLPDKRTFMEWVLPTGMKLGRSVGKAKPCFPVDEHIAVYSRDFTKGGARGTNPLKPDSLDDFILLAPSLK